jgi:hypothetical protein
MDSFSSAAPLESATTGARPDVGPVLPLSAGGGEHGDLLGAGDHPRQVTPDPIAAKVLNRGEALMAPTGRADDFSWPRSGAGASTASEIAPQPAALSSAAPPTKDEAKKAADVGKDNNQHKPGKESGVSKMRRPMNADLDGAPVPPLPWGRDRLAPAPLTTKLSPTQSF